MFHSWQFIFFSVLILLPHLCSCFKGITIDLVTAFKLQVNSSLYNTKPSLVDILLMINRENKHIHELHVTRFLCS